MSPVLPRHRMVVATAVVTAAAVTGGCLAAATASAHARATVTPVPASTLPTVAISSYKSALTVDTTSLRAGTYRFAVTAGKGDHSIVLLKLHPGYSGTQLAKDVQGAYAPTAAGLAAARRIDHRVTWLGGIDADTGTEKTFTATLPQGTVYAVDENTQQLTTIDVGMGSSPSYVAYNVHLVGQDGENWTSPGHFARSGTALFSNSSDEPHFLVLNKIKDSTTPSDIVAYIKSGKHSRPAFVQDAAVDTTTISPGQSMTFDYSLPPGKYLLACFWPSDEMAGVDHFAMGMWKVVHLE